MKIAVTRLSASLLVLSHDEEEEDIYQIFHIYRNSSRSPHPTLLRSQDIYSSRGISNKSRRMVTFVEDDHDEGFEIAGPIDLPVDLIPDKPATDLWGCFRVCFPQKTTANDKQRLSKVTFDDHLGGDGGAYY
jgi:hypothetical protein